MQVHYTYKQSSNLAVKYIGGGAIEAASGGLVSYATGGGDPLQGAAQGLVVYFANHLASHTKVPKHKTYKSPVKDNYGKQNGECVLRCLEEISESYGLTEYDYNYWFEKNGSNLGVNPNDVNSLVNGSGNLESKSIIGVNRFDNSNPASSIVESFENNKRVMVGFLTNKEGIGHAVMINKIKVWDSGKYKIWFSETSPVRLAPYTSNNISQDFPYGIRFYSISKTK